MKLSVLIVLFTNICFSQIYYYNGSQYSSSEKIKSSIRTAYQIKTTQLRGTEDIEAYNLYYFSELFTENISKRRNSHVSEYFYTIYNYNLEYGPKVFRTWSMNKLKKYLMKYNQFETTEVRSVYVDAQNSFEDYISKIIFSDGSNDEEIYLKTRCYKRYGPTSCSLSLVCSDEPNEDDKCLNLDL